ncbi:MAG: hypothetical protein ACHQQQ_10050 [Bacteroidota bacterium]
MNKILLFMNHLLFVFLFIFFAKPVFPQTDFWKQALGPSGGIIQTIAVAPNGAIFAGTDGNSVFRSTDNGESWNKTPGQRTVYMQRENVSSIKIDGAGNIYAIIDNQIQRSTDNGDHWTVPNPDYPWNQVSMIWLSDSGTVFAWVNLERDTLGGLYYSKNNGDNWKQIRSTMGQDVHGLSLVNKKGYVYYWVKGGVERSTDLGGSWKHITESPKIDLLTDNDLYSRLNNGSVSVSSDDGDSWKPSKNMLPVLGKLFYDKGLIFSLGGKFLRSTDSTFSFKKVKLEYTGLTVTDMAANTKDELFIATYIGVFKSTDRGVTWQRKNSGLSDFTGSNIFSLKNGQLLASLHPPTDEGSAWWEPGLYRSRDDGESWSMVDSGKGKSPRILCKDRKGYLYANTRSGFARSEDNGKTWKIFKQPPADIARVDVSPNGKIFVTTRAVPGNPISSTYRSDGLDSKWTKTPFPLGWKSMAFTHISSVLVSGVGVHLSTNNGAAWEKTLDRNNADITGKNMGPIFIAENGNIILSSHKAPNLCELYESTDNGTSWKLWNTIPADTIGIPVTDNAHQIYIGTSNGVFRYDRPTNAWVEMNSGLSDLRVIDLTITPNGFLVAGTMGGGIFRSVNKVE